MRRREVSDEHPWSLSPAGAEHRAGDPPPGDAVAQRFDHRGRWRRRGAPVVAACLRNAGAVGRWLVAHGYGTSATPGARSWPPGERWPDGSLRPALEDALGAGAVLHHLRAAGCTLSAEAAAMAAIYEAARRRSRPQVVRVGPAAVKAGYGADVEVAARLEADRSVPVLHAGRSLRHRSIVCLRIGFAALVCGIGFCALRPLIDLGCRCGGRRRLQAMGRHRHCKEAD